MDVWVLTRATGSYSDFGIDVLAVADSDDRAKALAGEQISHDHAAAVERVMERRQAWSEWREQQRDWHLSYYARTDGRTGRPHDSERCRDCLHYAKSAEEAYPLPALVTLTWKRNDNGEWVAAEPDDDAFWRASRMTLNQLAGIHCFTAKD